MPWHGFGSPALLIWPLLSHETWPCALQSLLDSHRLVLRWR
jgi:hypothetical protein